MAQTSDAELKPRYKSTLAPPAYYHGQGTHVALYARSHSGIAWQPSECDDYGCRAVDETVEREGVEGVRSAVRVDVMEDKGWDALRRRLDEDEGGENAAYDLVLGQNFIHMIPFPEGPRRIFTSLVSRSLVSRSAKLVLYGPFKHDGGFYSDSDEAFDKEISSRPSSYPLGLRSIDALAHLAAECGWALRERTGVAKGNWVLVFEQARGTGSTLGEDEP
ncbi:uncharacterized protein RHOBADRAFT_45675 [Rhodotorula graminis WP1]|uniref:25S rRNA (uridine-N(3))-methyltransferase BMT5-like domain-containing protein n=1 Tax=Rhodotorula graminis (strain WP1) TaxID=578459 RepID=A0A0N8PZZ7_RHOGW|nr:uncharacterized protein RHOBADRAFT_45675 [Rhodotorula graminis WP1]KPV73717.1 hypothetical protein RHOBADRAFT_45675 [Rhodotorula graminis WP1]